VSRTLQFVFFIVLVLLVQVVALAEPLDPSGKYTIEATLDIGTHQLDATEWVEYVNDGNTELTHVFFLLYPNFAKERNPYLDPAVVDGGYWDGFEAGGIDIEEVKDSDNKNLKFALEKGPDFVQTYSLKDTILRVELPSPLAAGASVQIKIKFSTHFPHIAGGDEGWHHDVYTWRFAWNPVAIQAKELIKGEYLSPERAYYKFALPAALYDLKMTIPSEYTAAFGGDKVEELQPETEGEKKRGKEWKTLHVTTQAPVRSVPFAIGKNLKKVVLKGEIVPIEVYYMPGHESAARQLATFANEILEYHSTHWGPFSYQRLALVESNAPGYFGMAADGIVILGNSAFVHKDLTVAGTADRLVDYLLAHEIGHQWWGIGVGADFNAENWLSEAFTEYVSITYFEEKYGEFGPNLIKLDRQGFLEKVVESQLGYLNLREHFSELAYLATVKDRFDEAVIKPAQDVQFANNSTQRIYNKGYLMIRALRSIIGTEKLHEVLKESNKRFVHKLISTNDFQKLAEELAGESGRNLEYYFDQMLRKDQPVAPTLDYGVSGFESEKIDKEKYRVTVQVHRKGDLQLPAEVVIVTDNDDEVSQTWTPTGTKQEATLVFESPRPVKEARIDPKSWLPDINRLNNNWPSRQKIITTGDNDLPIDAYLIKISPLSQTVEGGYLLDHRWLMGNGFAAGIINFGRGMVGQVALGLVENQLIGQLAFRFSLFQNPNIGLRSTYWEPTDTFAFSVARLLDTSQNPLRGTPIIFGGLDYRRGESARHLYAFGVSMREGFYCCRPDTEDLEYFTALSFSGATLLKLFANVHLQVYGTMGLSWDAPGMFRFALQELTSFYKTGPDGKLQRLFFPGNFKALGRASVNFPVRRELAYYIMNLAIVDRVDVDIFVTAGQTSNTLEGLQNINNLKAEAGLAVTVSGTAFSGFLPISVTLGVAMPLQGIDEFHKRPRLFFGTNLPF